jgi:protein-tyrosine phosphatase
MIDLHNHLLPGIDDGAADLSEAGAALHALHAQGVHTLVATPHLDASLAFDPHRLAARLQEIDAAWTGFRGAASALPELRIERGAEVRLDTPEPELDDARLRLAGTRFTLVEFPSMTVPPNAERPIRHMILRGWTPVIAHPERYGGLDPSLRDVERWRGMGALVQVNAGSLLGRYGGGARGIAWKLLERGWVDYLSSDYHARGRVALADARNAVTLRGEAQARLLFEGNAARLLAGQGPLEVAPLPPSPSVWRRIFGAR